MDRPIFVPQSHAREAKQQADEKRNLDILLDFLYRRIYRDATDDEINRDLGVKGFPRMTADELKAAREYFKKVETHKPQVIANIKRRLGLAA